MPSFWFVLTEILEIKVDNLKKISRQQFPMKRVNKALKSGRKCALVSQLANGNNNYFCGEHNSGM